MPGKASRLRAGDPRVDARRGEGRRYRRARRSAGRMARDVGHDGSRPHRRDSGSHAGRSFVIHADLIVVDADVVTMDPAQPRAQAFAVRDGASLPSAVRPMSRALAGPRTRVVERRRPHGHAGHDRRARAPRSRRPAPLVSHARTLPFDRGRATRRCRLRRRSRGRRMDRHRSARAAAVSPHAGGDARRAALSRSRRSRRCRARASGLDPFGVGPLDRWSALHARPELRRAEPPAASTRTPRRRRRR